MSPDLTAVTDTVSVVEIHSDDLTAQIVAPDQTGLIEVHDSTSTVVIEDPPGVQTIEVVTAGPVGPRGPKGEQGDVGPFAPLFIQEFAIPSDIWVIHHSLDTFPVVTTVDLNGEEIVGDVTATDRNTVVVTFAVPMAGTARLKA